MKRSLLFLAFCIAFTGCATPSASHYSVTPKVRVIERTPKRISSHTPAVVSGSAGAVQ